MLGFDASGRGCGLAAVEALVSTRAELAEAHKCYFPVMGVHDGLGAVCPNSRLPYQMAVSAGLSDASLKMVGTTMVGTMVRDDGRDDGRWREFIPSPIK